MGFFAGEELMMCGEFWRERRDRNMEFGRELQGSIFCIFLTVMKERTQSKSTLGTVPTSAHTILSSQK